MRATLPVTVVLSLIVGFALGALAMRDWGPPKSTAFHWRVVNAYRAHINDPANYQYDPQTGLSSAELPPDPEPSLFALVNAGELSHLDLVFPNVEPTTEVDRRWLKFAEGHPEVLHAVGNSAEGVGAIDTSGKEPLHLKIWFRPSALDAVKQLVKELDPAAEIRN